MNLSEVLRLLASYNVNVFEDFRGEGDCRFIIVGCTLPKMPYGGRMAYATLVLEPGVDEVTLEQRETLKRRLCHLTTDIFGDDARELHDAESDEPADGGKPGNSQLHNIVKSSGGR